MKINKKKLVETLANEILREVSVKVREIVREEMEIEKRRLRKQIISEIKQLKINKIHSGSNGASKEQSTTVSTKKIDTGNNYINSILEEIKADSFEGPEMKLDTGTSFEEASKVAAIQENRKPVHEDKLWSPSKDEAYNFDPRKMDPSKIDWSNFVDKLDEKK